MRFCVHVTVAPPGADGTRRGVAVSSIETRVDDFDLAAGPNFMLLMTFFCAAVAIALTVFILGWLSREFAPLRTGASFLR